MDRPDELSGLECQGDQTLRPKIGLRADEKARVPDESPEKSIHGLLRECSLNENIGDGGNLLRGRMRQARLRGWESLHLIGLYLPDKSLGWQESRRRFR
jgi:hypothetical protein